MGQGGGSLRSVSGEVVINACVGGRGVTLIRLAVVPFTGGGTQSSPARAQTAEVEAIGSELGLIIR